MAFQPSSQQASALEVIGKRLDAGEPETRLFGYAGTGKTSIARYIAQHEPGQVLFAAFTGKAASVLTRKGCPASTIHSLIYLPAGDRTAQLEKLEKEYMEIEDPDSEYAQELGAKVAELQKNIGKPGFVLNPASVLSEADLLIVDEVSMVDDRLAADLTGFGVPIIALGDPAQLPPVGKGGYFTKGGEDAADAMLRKVERFALDSQIYRLANWIRENQTRPPYKKGVVVKSVGQAAALEYDQILVGTNKTRRSKNAKMRKLLGHDSGEILNPGERIIVLDNNKDLQILNGQQFRAVDVKPDGIRPGQIEVYMQCECPDTVPLPVGCADVWAMACSDCGWVPKWVPMWIHGFLGEKGEEDLKGMPYNIKRGAATGTFGYAITVHKSQGSEWNNVLVFDESSVFRRDAWRWLYTAVTRAQEKVTVVR